MSLDQKLVSLATVRAPTEKELQEFKPTDAHEAIAGALNEPESPSTLAALADKAGVSVRTLQRAISDPAALTWMVSQASRLAEARLGAVHARLYRMALTSKSATWAKLYMERFDRDYKRQQILERGGAQQFNFIEQMDDNELFSWLKRMQRKLQGPASAPDADEGTQRLPGPDQSGNDPFPTRDLGSVPDGLA